MTAAAILPLVGQYLEEQRRHMHSAGQRWARRTPAKAAAELPALGLRVAEQGLDNVVGAGALGKAEGILSQLHAATRCRICGRDLTDPKSVERGIGPDCIAKLKAEAAQEKRWRDAMAALGQPDGLEEEGDNGGRDSTADVVTPERSSITIDRPIDNPNIVEHDQAKGFGVEVPDPGPAIREAGTAGRVEYIRDTDPLLAQPGDDLETLYVKTVYAAGPTFGIGIAEGVQVGDVVIRHGLEERVTEAGWDRPNSLYRFVTLSGRVFELEPGTTVTTINHPKGWEALLDPLTADEARRKLLLGAEGGDPRRIEALIGVNVETGEVAGA